MADQPETPLGLGEFSNPSYTPDVFPLAADDIVLLYTDGVIEARDQEGTFYPLAERITSSAAGYPETLVQWIRDDLLAYSGGSLGDDAAMIALQRAPASPAASASSRLVRSASRSLHSSAGHCTIAPRPASSTGTNWAPFPRRGGAPERTQEA
ncbi:PP2C family protein-serine/threonine phosphatase [Streptomyces sp. NBC_01446]|uniref:Serine/threonine-protein phosphatase n=1 Tax=Streptomyces sp. NBC_00119 TaxID=2975659 RepID=A0AAU1ULW2_9ACTN|nr:PP2C family protein-serine/threonine phosphatase [Streptomyces sp. NBC_01446]MCX4649321.1 serine/threonine-protein phosphatase [Streptomyces sp. NBC_01446]